MLSKFTDEQLGFVYTIIEPSIGHYVLKEPKDVEVVKEVAKESNHENTSSRN